MKKLLILFLAAAVAADGAVFRVPDSGTKDATGSDKTLPTETGNGNRNS